jgi:hypothetical protein
LKSLAQRVHKDNDDDDDDLSQKLGMKFVVGNEVCFFLDWSFWLIGWLVGFCFVFGFGSFGL